MSFSLFYHVKSGTNLGVCLNCGSHDPLYCLKNASDLRGCFSCCSSVDHKLLQSTKMLNHTKISTVSSAIIVLLLVQFLFIDHVTGFKTDSQHDRKNNNAVRRETAEKNRNARDLYMTRGNDDVIHGERDVTGKQVSFSSSSPSLPSQCPTYCKCHYYPEYLEMLLRCKNRHTNATSLSREIDAYLPSVAWNFTKLTIMYTPLTAVPESICQLKQLTRIFLHRNNFTTGLPDNCFSRLHELQYLTAVFSRLASLQNGLFANLTNLRSVDFSGNRISSIDAHLFDNLINLHSLYLSSNNISSIAAHVFDNLTNLRRVDLSLNQISSIDAHLFANLTNLKRVDLSRNQISYIDAHLFANLINLQSVDLSFNQIAFIDAHLFDNLFNLQSVDLSSNQISSIDAHLFDNLFNLQSVDLSSNQISSIDAHLFDNLFNLQSVDLSSNQLSSIDAHLFDNLTNLQKVDLSYNQMSSIGAHLFDNLAKLQSVDLSFNHISSIDARLFAQKANLPNLRNIVLSHNNLTEIDTWPVKRVQLINGSNIDLSYNNISRFTNSLGWHYDCNSVPLLSPTIDLSYNNIRHLNDLLGGWNITGLYFSIHAHSYCFIMSYHSLRHIIISSV